MGCNTCEKPKVNYKKGLWSPDEDQRLSDYMLKHGHGCWSSIPMKVGLQRNGKSCRLRWINYLRPGLKHGVFSREEEETVMKLHAALGNKWSQIAMHIPGRTDNEVKNYWNSYLKKRVNFSHASSPSSSKSRDSNHKVSETSPNNKLSDSDSNHESPLFDSGSSYVAPQISALPRKILFADWQLTTTTTTTNDHVNGAEPSCQWDSTSQTSQGVQPNGEFLHGFANGDIYRGFLSEIQTEGNQLDGSGFFDIFSMGEICGNLGIDQHDDDIY